MNPDVAIDGLVPFIPYEPANENLAWAFVELLNNCHEILAESRDALLFIMQAASAKDEQAVQRYQAEWELCQERLGFAYEAFGQFYDENYESLPEKYAELLAPSQTTRVSAA